MNFKLGILIFLGFIVASLSSRAQGAWFRSDPTFKFPVAYEVAYEDDSIGEDQPGGSDETTVAKEVPQASSPVASDCPGLQGELADQVESGSYDDLAD